MFKHSNKIKIKKSKNLITSKKIQLHKSIIHAFKILIARFEKKLKMYVYVSVKIRSYFQDKHSLIFFLLNLKDMKY